MKHRIMIEGADTLGKTTAMDTARAKLQHKQSGIAPSHRKMGLPEAEWSESDWLHWASREDSCFVDRGPLSEIIYGHVARGRAALSSPGFMLALGMLARAQYRIVIVTAPSFVYGDILAKRYDASREAFDKPTILKVNNCYRRLATTGIFRDYEIPEWFLKNHVIHIDIKSVESFPSISDLIQ